MRHLLITALLFVGACVRPRTEIVATISSELSWGTGQRLQSLSVEVRSRDASGPQRSLRFFPLGTENGRTTLPLAVGILPDVSRAANDPTPVWIEVLGCAGSGCSRTDAVVSQRAIVQFAQGETLDLRLLLAAACVANRCDSMQRCDPSDGTCVGARVVPPPVGTLSSDAGLVMGGRDVVGVDAPDAVGAAVDVQDATVVPDVPDASTGMDVQFADVPDVPIARDVSFVDGASADAGTSMTMTGTFVGAGISGTSGALTLRGVITWHAAVRGTGGGIALEGWVQ